MKHIRLVLAVALFLSFGAFAYSQDTPPKSKRQNQEEPSKHPEVTPPRQPEVSPPRGQEETKPPKAPPETKPPKMEKPETPKPSKEQPKVTHEQHGTAQQRQARPAGKSAHIPDPQFKANFGRQHRFTVNRVITTTTIVPNQTRFFFAGYTFIFLDPWPTEWLFTDDCYIDFFDDQYFLFDAFHPGLRVALFVVG